MPAVAYIKYCHISPKKIRELGSACVGLTPSEAIDRLLLNEKKGGKILAAAIKSAQSNAVNNLKLDAKSLKIKTIEILKGPFLKRWQPVSRGMAHQIKKRTTHIKVTLEEITPAKKEVKIKKDIQQVNKKESGTPKKEYGT